MKNTYELLVVGTGGFFGSTFRYLVSGWMQKGNANGFFPYGTLSVNVAGCLLIGLIGGLSENVLFIPKPVRLFFLAGFLGGFTTFSTFGYETLALIRDRQILAAAVNIFGNLCLGLCAVWIGFSLISTWDTK